MPVRLVTSLTLKLLGMGLLVLLAMIPLAMVRGLIDERADRRADVLTETAASWGGRQVLGGVALTVPFEVTERNGDRWQTVERLARFLPDSLRIEARLEPEVRQRSIFEVVVYRVRAKISGELAPPDLSRLMTTAAAVHWERARFSIDVRDMRGVTEVSPLMWDGKPLALEPDGPGSAFVSGLGAPVPFATLEPSALSAAGPVAGAVAGPVPGLRGRVPFSVSLTLAGAEHLAFLPAGGTTEVTLTSPWPHPGFSGAFLPEQRQIDDRGFSARWRVLSFARAYPQAWIAGAGDTSEQARQVAKSEFGVELVQTADVYQQADRATKYGVLFVLLTFTVFFLWELLQSLRIHPIQYMLVGMALVVFYLLLVSISEHLRFQVAYLVASSATVLLIAGYAVSILSAGWLGGLAIGGWLAALYAILYVLLRLEDLALLVGAGVVFAALAAVMYLTRRVNWYSALAAPAESARQV
jgi:inner membrane protein